MRKQLVAGNWKMHGSKQFVTSLLQELVQQLGNMPREQDIVVCPTALHLPLAAQALLGSGIALGAQNVYSQNAGAFTGEIAPVMLAEYAVRFVILGHSERRQIFGETDAQIAEKFVAVQDQNLIPILCVGETLAQREQGITDKVVRSQIEAVLAKVAIDKWADAVIAYEPVWAIGTGKTAAPEQAQEVHGMIRQHLRQRHAEVAERIRIVYGGSVNPANAAALFAQADIDGGLIGGASLKSGDFASICRCLE